MNIDSLILKMESISFDQPIIPELKKLYIKNILSGNVDKTLINELYEHNKIKIFKLIQDLLIISVRLNDVNSKNIKILTFDNELSRDLTICEKQYFIKLANSEIYDYVDNADFMVLFYIEYSDIKIKYQVKS